MTLATLSEHLDINPDGSGDTKYPDGDKDPAPATASWGDLSALADLVAQRTTGSSLSHDLAQYALGSGLGSATYSVVSVSGTALAGIYATSSANLTSPGTLTGAGFFKLGITVSGDTVYSAPIAWSWTAPITDTLAPCLPTGGDGVAGTGTATFSCDIPGDPHDGTYAGAMSTVQLRIGGATQEEISVGAGLSPSWTLTNIGSSTPSPSFIQTGQNWALSGGGAGFDSASDQFPFNHALFSGDFRLTLEVTALSAAVSNFSKCGLMVRETSAAGSRYFACYVMANGKAQVKSRATTDGSAVSQTTTASAIGLPAWLQIERSGDDLTGRYCTDGLVWTDLVTQTIPLSQSVLGGICLASQSDGNAVAASVTQLWANNAGRVTFTPVSSVVAVTAQFRAKDAANNLSAASASVSITPNVAVQKRWHPGHYVKTQGTHTQTNQSGYLSSVISQFNRISDSAHLKGAYATLAWGAVNTTGSTFSRTGIDSLIAALSAGKKLILGLSYKSFQASAAGLIMPSDIVAQAVATNSGWIAPIWRSDVMDRYIALMEWVADEFDDNVVLEMVTGDECSPSLGSGAPADYSASALGTQLRRCYAAMGVAFSKINAMGMVNSLTNQGAGLIEAAYQAKLGRSGPDAFDDSGSKVFRGDQVSSQGATVRDYRGLIPHMVIGSSPVLGGKDDNGPATNIINWAQTNNVTHLPWISTATTTGNTWANILSAIAADSALATTCPLNYPSGCNVA